MLEEDEMYAAINEIRARNGYRFKDDSLFSYYSGFAWYEPRISSDSWSDDKYLSDLEQENISLLQRGLNGDFRNLGAGYRQRMAKL
jgi:hypothetical protein